MSVAADRAAGALGSPKLVIIDLDGTLVDTVPDLSACVDTMLVSLGRMPCGEARVRTWVGNGVDRLIKRSLTGRLDGEPDPPLFERARRLFMSCYGENTSRRSRPYPGAVRALDQFRQRGILLVCVTNKPGKFTTKLLADLGLLERFDLILSGDTLPQRKPDPLPLLHAAGHFGLPPAQCLMVGDSKTDVAAARAAGIPVVCVSYGYNHGEDIRAAGPDAVIDSLEEFSDLLAADVESARRPPRE